MSAGHAALEFSEHTQHARRAEESSRRRAFESFFSRLASASGFALGSRVMEQFSHDKHSLYTILVLMSLLAAVFSIEARISVYVSGPHASWNRRLLEVVESIVQVFETFLVFVLVSTLVGKFTSQVTDEPWAFAVIVRPLVVIIGLVALPKLIDALAFPEPYDFGRR